ncbi:hypothetical protein INR49_030341, partial [Caranx melampygus]
MIPEPTATAASRPSRQSKSSRDEANSSGAVNHSEDESGNENRQKSVRKRKRAHNGSENVKHKSVKASRSSVGRAGGSKRRHVEAVTLFEVVTMGRSAMQMVEELDEVSSLQYKKFLAFPWILTVTWPTDSDSAEYPLTQPGPYGRWFHSEFCEFVSVLVAQCQRSVIFDGYLMNTLISLLTELSDSYVRAFRHTCTLAAMKLLSSLVGVALSLSVGIENSQKLYKVQKTKTSRQRNTSQLERIQKKITELQEKRVEIESMMDIIFKGTPDVRLKCVLGLQGLYEDPLLLPKLDLFTSRFKDRMISMTLDKDNEVAVQTMKLLLLLSKTSDDVLSPDDYRQLLQFVYSSQRPLAATAGELLFSRLLNTAAPAADTQEQLNEEEAHKQQTSARLKALLNFYQQSELHKHVVYLVDSLWDCAGALLKDWATLTSILLQDHSPGLTLAEQAVLVEILVASVRQASEGPVLPGRSGAKKATSAREKKVQMEDCAKLTEHLLVVLPQLLSKFSSSRDIVASLMRIPQYFLQCPEAENTQAVSTLVAEMGAVLERHSDPAVLEAAARTYLSLCAEETSWCSVARAARDSLVQTWVDHLTLLLEDSVRCDCFSADEEKTGDILATLKKLRAFHNCHDLSQWSVFELLSPLLSVESGQGAAAPPEITFLTVSSAPLGLKLLLEVLQCLCYFILWSLNTSGETLTSREKAVAQRLQLRLFCERSHHCLSHSDHNVQQQAFLGVCDVLTAHSYQLHVWDPTSFGPLLYTPSPKLQRALLTFVCKQAFVGPDCDSQSRVSEALEVERLEDLHRRRNLLAAFCKLIYFNDFGDIIKETMYRTRQMDKIESARTLVLCLQQLFVRLKKEQESGGRAQPGFQTFTSIKELARRFALTFGDLVKFRECVVVIHRNGIEFVFQEFSQTPDTTTPPYLSYLTILSEFSCKLLKTDKKTVFSYLQKHTAEHIIDLRDECWQPLIYYRASLLAAAEGEDAVSYVSSDRRPHPPNRSPFSKQKLEGNKSPCPFSPADPKLSKGHRLNFSPSQQEKTPDVDLFSVPLDPPARRLNTEGSVLSTGNGVDDDTVGELGPEPANLRPDMTRPAERYRTGGMLRLVGCGYTLGVGLGLDSSREKKKEEEEEENTYSLLITLSVLPALVKHLAEAVLEGKGLDSHGLQLLTLLVIEVLQLVHAEHPVPIQ